MKIKFLIFLVLLLGASSVSAVMRAEAGGAGQVVIVPYFSVNEGNDTLVHVRNLQDTHKAVKVRSRDLEGNVSFSANVYLKPSDSWSFAITRNSNQIPIILTRDESCVVPSIPMEGSPVASAEGFLEFIEMGEVVGNITQAPCLAFEFSWSIGGLWDNDPSNSIVPSSGGISVNTNIINVAEGRFFEVPSTSIAEVYGTSSHTRPASTEPNLGSGDNVFAEILSNNVSSVYQFATPLDALGAAIMATNMNHTFNVDAGLSARTDLVITYPTRHLYPAQEAPFSDTNILIRGGVCSESGQCISGNPDLSFITNSSVQVISLGSENSIPSLNQINYSPPFTSGVFYFTFDNDGQYAIDDGFGNTFLGLPQLSFTARTFTNSTLVIDGDLVLSNYATSERPVTDVVVEN